MNLTTREFLDRKYHFVQIIEIRETMKVSDKPESNQPQFQQRIFPAVSLPNAI